MKSVAKTVKAALNEGSYRGGYVSNDGNGMVGGRWGSYSAEAIASIDVDDVLKAGFPAEALNIIYDSLSVDDELIIYGTMSVSFDESVGSYDDCDIEDIDDSDARGIMDDLYHEIEETGIVDHLVGDVQECIDKCIDAFDILVEDLKPADFTWTSEPGDDYEEPEYYDD